MPQRPEVDRLTDYYAKSMMTKPIQWFCRKSGKSKFCLLYTSNRTKNIVFVGNNVQARALAAALPGKNVLFALDVYKRQR